MHFLMLLISDSALLPFSATGGGRKATIIARLLVQIKRGLILKYQSSFNGASDGT
jgi:hypothetical protein